MTRTNTIMRTCVRCHTKKIRCAGYPDCRSCAKANIMCELHQRQRKQDTVEALKYYKERTSWLESQLQELLGIPCADVANGTPIQLQPDRSSASTVEPSAAGASHPEASALPFEHGELQNASTEPTPDASIVALNATGDARYLGPSSGIFFALYANTYAQLSSIGDGGDRATDRDAEQHANGNQSADGGRSIDLDSATLLARAFCAWVTPLYPIFSSGDIDSMLVRCIALEAAQSFVAEPSPRDTSDLAIFYLVMSLGAIHQQGTVRRTRQPPAAMSQGLSSGSLFDRALRYINAGAGSFVPSVSSIQTLLLLSLYSMHGPVASTQWQIVGSAMRMAIELGLHSSSNNPVLCGARETETRQRVFWTAYILEITLAYNLGRPPSIGEEHITIALPNQSATGMTSILHIKHRQIQHRLISKVYSANAKATRLEAQAQIASLQGELDNWKTEMSSLIDEDFAPYSHDFWLRLYHGTNFVLHRASPLCPNPPMDSTRMCLRSAGAYITDVTKVLQHSDVPLSWMLIQGVLFAGLTVLVTARLSAGSFDAPDSLTLVSVDLPAWTRQCSICLAIMNERWDNALLFRLTRQFDAMVNDTLRFLSSDLTRSHSFLWLSQPIDVGSNHASGTDSGVDYEIHTPRIADGDSFLDLLGDTMGFEPHHSFWDPFPPPSL